MIETIGEGFHSEELAGCLRKVDPNESVSLDPFTFVGGVCGRGGIYVIHRGGRKFVGLVLQGQPDGSTVSNIFEGSFTEEGMGAGNSIFEGWFKFASYYPRKNYKGTDSAYQGAIGE